MKKIIPLLLLIVFNIANSQNISKVLGKAMRTTDSSKFYFEKAKKMISNDDELAEYNFYKGAWFVDHNLLDSSIIFTKKAISHLEKNDKKNLIYYCYNNLAKNFSQKGEYTKTIEIIIKNLKKAEQNNNYSWQYVSLIGLSDTYHNSEQYEKGVFYGKKALNLVLKTQKKDVQEIQNSLNQIAICYDDWNKPNEALTYHYKILDFVKGKDTLTISNTYNNIGNTLLKQKKYKNAESWIKRAIKINISNKTNELDKRISYKLATNYTNLATIAYETDDFEKAEKLFVIAEKHVKESQNIEKERDFYLQRLKFNKKRGNLNKTIEDQEKYIEIRDSIYVSEKAEKIAEVETKYQTEKKQNELNIERVKNAENLLSLSKKNNQIIITSIVALLFLLLGYLLFRQQKTKNQQQKQESALKEALLKIEAENQLQEQRLGISKELHDNIGSQLTFVISSIDTLKQNYPSTNEKIDNQLENINAFTKNTITELRDTVWVMNTKDIDANALKERLLDNMERAKMTYPNINFKVEIDSFSIDNSVVALNLFRTIQEGINNALKYANATQIEIGIHQKNDQIEAFVKDNGVGFDIETQITSKLAMSGNGLKNMKKRVKSIKGTFNISSSENFGTKVEISVPRAI